MIIVYRPTGFRSVQDYCEDVGRLLASVEYPENHFDEEELAEYLAELSDDTVVFTYSFFVVQVMSARCGVICYQGDDLMIEHKGGWSRPWDTAVPHKTLSHEVHLQSIEHFTVEYEGDFNIITDNSGLIINVRTREDFEHIRSQAADLDLELTFVDHPAIISRLASGAFLLGQGITKMQLRGERFEPGDEIDFGINPKLDLLPDFGNRPHDKAAYIAFQFGRLAKLGKDKCRLAIEGKLVYNGDVAKTVDEAVDYVRAVVGPFVPAKCSELVKVGIAPMPSEVSFASILNPQITTILIRVGDPKIISGLETYSLACYLLAKGHDNTLPVALI